MPEDTQAPEVVETPEAQPDPAATPVGESADPPGAKPAKKAARKATKKASTRKAAADAPLDAPPDPPAGPPADPPADDDPASDASEAAPTKSPAKRSAAKKAVSKTAATKKAAAKATTKKAATAAKRVGKKAAAAAAAESPTGGDAAVDVPGADVPGVDVPGVDAPLDGPPVVVTRTRSSAAKRTRKTAAQTPPADAPSVDETPDDEAPAVPAVLFQTPDAPVADAPTGEPTPDPESEDDDAAEGEGEGEGDGTGRRRRRRGGRRRRKSADGGSDANGASGPGEAAADEPEQKSDQKPDEKSGQRADPKQGAGTDADESTADGGSRRRRRRRRSGDDGGEGGDEADRPVTRARRTRSAEDQITAVSGSTRLEAKKQRRREGREAGRRRAPIVSEAEFLARRESVERVMVVRQRDDLTQIGVLEDKVLVEHYVSRESQTSLIGNIYLGRVQNVLPSMEAAFIDIGRGRNAVLYAGEVNWSALGHKDGQARKIESVLSSGQAVLVQVTKDPVGHKGARLTSQISLAGRFLVYVPDGTTSGISRKLPDTERHRLKTLLKEIVPDTAGVIVRTAAEGASEEELTRDVERLKERFADIEKKTKGSAPQLLYGEPDLTLKVVRDLFTEDFSSLVIQGDDAWDTVRDYVAHVAPDLEARLARYDPAEHNDVDLFSAYRVDEQIAKALDRKVWLPSGGSLIVDRTEAMTVVDVNTGKFTGSGGNLEETVTKNNLEAAEEVVRQLRLRDIGGIIVVDFIDMVLESNRDLVLRRLVECLGRDRTRHQVAEVTSLGLVQMTRKRIGTGLLEAFSETCEHCAGRGLIIHEHPVESGRSEEEPRRGGGRRSRGGRGRGQDDADARPAGGDGQAGNGAKTPTPREFAAMARHRESDPDGTSAPEPEDSPADAAEAVETDLETALVADAVQEAVAEAEVDEADVVDEVDADDEVDEADVDEEDDDLEPLDAEPEPAEPEPEPAEPEAVEQEPTEPAEPEPPRVVTRTRRRSASRPAGPPTPVLAPGPGGPGSDDGLAGVVGVPQTDDDVAGGVGHVPVKRRGARKR